MAETLTGSQRLRAFITGKVDKIADLEAASVADHAAWEIERGKAHARITDLEASAETWQELDTAHTARIIELEAEIAGFQGLADEYAPAQLEAPAKG